MFLVFKIIFNFTSSTFKNVHKKTLTKLRNDISFQNVTISVNNNLK